LVLPASVTTVCGPRRPASAAKSAGNCATGAAINTRSASAVSGGPVGIQRHGPIDDFEVERGVEVGAAATDADDRRALARRLLGERERAPDQPDANDDDLGELRNAGSHDSGARRDGINRQARPPGPRGSVGFRPGAQLSRAAIPEARNWRRAAR
jgi:hypothetical protein